MLVGILDHRRRPDDLEKQLIEYPEGLQKPDELSSGEAGPAGMGYGMLPRMQVAEGRLVSIAPDPSLAVPLYWHFWRHSGEVLKRLTEVVAEVRLR